MKKERTLLIDDTRDLASADVIARNFDEGIRQLSLNGPWDVLLLDHDLASYDEAGREHTGYDVMLWLEEQVVNNKPGALPGRIECVSANPVGRERIKAVIRKLYDRKA